MTSQPHSSHKPSIDVDSLGFLFATIRGDLELGIQTPSVQADHVVIIADSPKGGPLRPSATLLAVNPIFVIKPTQLKPSSDSFGNRKLAMPSWQHGQNPDPEHPQKRLDLNLQDPQLGALKYRSPTEALWSYCLFGRIQCFC
jgi:hypothetical protein